MTKFAKVENGRVYCCNSNTGGYFTSFGVMDGGQVVFAEYHADQNRVLVLSSRGYVYIYNDRTGGYSSSFHGFGDDIVMARWSGDNDNIIITTKSGRTKLCSRYGGVIRDL